jgi:hypothetical protein
VREWDAGSVVVGWLAKIAVVLIIVAGVGFDALSIGLAHLNGADNAATAATAASDTWLTTHDLDQAYASAVASAASAGESVVPGSFRVEPDGTVVLAVRTKVRTMLVQLIPPLRPLAEVTATGQGKWFG